VIGDFGEDVDVLLTACFEGDGAAMGRNVKAASWDFGDTDGGWLRVNDDVVCTWNRDASYWDAERLDREVTDDARKSDEHLDVEAGCCEGGDQGETTCWDWNLGILLMDADVVFVWGKSANDYLEWFESNHLQAALEALTLIVTPIFPDFSSFPTSEGSTRTDPSRIGK
jgi:hypothetical protein